MLNVNIFNLKIFMIRVLANFKLERTVLKILEKFMFTGFACPAIVFFPPHTLHGNSNGKSNDSG